jgi:mono/diheme cytochrome c family protein
MYARYCTNCHGANGRSGRTLKNIVREADDVPYMVRHGHGGTNYGSRTGYMPSWTTDQISDADLALLQSYVSAL